MSDSKVLIWNSHSSNNRDIFELSTINHSRYAEEHNYTLLNICEPYRKTIDAGKLICMLACYDIVATMGSDILITDMTKKIEDFAIAPISAFKEFQGIHNGDLIIFNRDIEAILMLDAVQRRTGCVQTAITALANSGDKVAHAAGLQGADPWLNRNYTEHPEFLWKPGDFCNHFHTVGYGCNNEMKLEAMKKFIAEH